MLALGKLYQVTHKSFGTFIARAIEPGDGWCGFQIVDGNAELLREGFPSGAYIELTADFYKARAL